MAKFTSSYSRSFTIPSYALDKHEKTNLTYLIQLIQETGSYHAHGFNLTVSDLIKEGKTWMLTKQRIDILRYPTWPDRVRVDTWIEKPTRFSTPRLFKVYDENENLILTAVTYWCIIDLDTHRPLPITSLEDLGWVETSPLPLEPIKKLRIPEDDSFALFSSDPIIRYQDSDLNKHVNNTVYSDWCLDSLPAAFRDKKQPKSIEIHYLKETYADDRVSVTSRFEEATGICYHTIEASNGGEMRIVCNAKSIWEDR